MKITAEFNSNEELLNFISTFGTKTIVTGKAVDQVTKETVVASKPEVKKDTKKVEVTKENKKEDVKKEDKKEATQADTKTEESKAAEEVKDDKKEEDPKITKEMIRAIFTKLIKAGKQKEAKEITEKYGAKRLPDLAEEHYEAAYKEVEALL